MTILFTQTVCECEFNSSRTQQQRLVELAKIRIWVTGTVVSTWETINERSTCKVLARARKIRLLFSIGCLADERRGEGHSSGHSSSNSNSSIGLCAGTSGVNLN
ncbi:hypothetical protein HZH66_011321 [Vespula vulgaris]|uniref:Uncharacterized protein n=1 Tax=Vespula vulgaris TaxID=7454 RepID=A0A834MX38_VESVU|nr:hypothetical protein HZH66_011321 [Vespula vulgaris]